MQKKGRIFSGMRPTGRLHLGHLLGALDNWVKLQDEYQCLFGVVDWHALSTEYEDTSSIRQNTREIAIDWLAAGIDPEKSVLLVQSRVKEHAELHLLLSMVTPLAWVERVPTYKEQLRQLEGRELATYGFLGYPVLQAADILIYKADLVPVGEDQLPHLELTREIARRFNYLYGRIFPDPQARINADVPLLPGIDGRKMSKSYGNYINLSADPGEIREKVNMMITDPARARRHDPGNPEVCTVFAFHRVFSGPLVEETAMQCRKAGIGCVQCKQVLADKLVERLAGVYERRLELEKDPARVEDILEHGSRVARQLASRTMEEVREAMRI